jgi:putative tryptophan/tyrosine transport system substrate-binding protein
MRRREFIALTAGAFASASTAQAQRQELPVIGFLHSASPISYATQLIAFRLALKESGFVDGQNLMIEFRWAENQFDRLPAMAAELVQRKVTVLVAGGSPISALAAKAATSAIPIVFMNVADPVAIGLVESYNRPGGNLTGATLLSAELTAKRLGILRDLLPSMRSISVLVNPTRPGVEAQKAQVEEAAQKLGLDVHFLEASRIEHLEAAFQSVISKKDQALVVAPDTFFLTERVRITALAASYRVATMYELRDFVDAGGLISYGAKSAELYYQGGILTSQVLMGKKPAELPIRQPTKFELAISVKAAKALGLTISPNLLSIADDLLE